MNDPMPTIVKRSVNGFTMESCHRNIPDLFREIWYYPLTESELPEAKATDIEFEGWLRDYRNATESLGKKMLEASRCN